MAGPQPYSVPAGKPAPPPVKMYGTPGGASLTGVSGRTHYVDVCLRAVTDVDVDGLHLAAGDALPEDWCEEHLDDVVQLLETGAIEVVPEADGGAAG
jgi:hypothetical protein